MAGRRMTREEAREYFDKHSLADQMPDERLGAEVKAPLSTVLSLRISDEHAAKLKAMARGRKIGMTTLARQLLEQALESPDEPVLSSAQVEHIAEQVYKKMRRLEKTG